MRKWRSNQSADDEGEGILRISHDAFSQLQKLSGVLLTDVARVAFLLFIHEGQPVSLIPPRHRFSALQAFLFTKSGARPSRYR